MYRPLALNMHYFLLLNFDINGVLSNMSSLSKPIQTSSTTLFNYELNSPVISSDHNDLVIKSHAKTDFFIAPDDSYTTSNAPVVLHEVDNTRPFVFLAKIQPEFQTKYDAGALFIFHSNEKWLKFAFELDDIGFTRIVSVKTTGYSDDNNHEKIDSKSIFLKIASNTKQIGCYYSLDGESWTMARLFKNDFENKLFLGLSSQSPVGEGCDTQFTNILFEYANLADFRLGK